MTLKQYVVIKNGEPLDKAIIFKETDKLEEAMYYTYQVQTKGESLCIIDTENYE